VTLYSSYMLTPFISEVPPVTCRMSCISQYWWDPIRRPDLHLT